MASESEIAAQQKMGIKGYNYEYGHPCCKKEYPPPDKIKARAFEDLENEKRLVMAFPYDMARGNKVKLTSENLKAAVERVENQLKSDIERYEDIRKRGDAAMSKYDLSFGYTALNSGLPLKYAHIGYNRGRLEILKYWQKKLFPKNIETKKGEQKELF